MVGSFLIRRCDIGAEEALARLAVRGVDVSGLTPWHRAQLDDLAAHGGRVVRTAHGERAGRVREGVVRAREREGHGRRVVAGRALASARARAEVDRPLGARVVERHVPRDDAAVQ